MKDLIIIGKTAPFTTESHRHSHDVWEIVYYMSGSGTITVGDNSIPFAAGKLLLLPPVIPHFERAIEPYQNIHLLLGSFGGFGSACSEFYDGENRDLLTLLTMMHREYHLKTNNWRNIVEQQLGLLHQYLLAQTGTFRLSPLVEKLQDVLISHISDADFSVETVLNTFPESPDHLRKRFAKETGKTPHAYLTDKRIAFAEEMLSSRSDQPYKIKEIAEMCGYADAHYFSRLFKQNTGVSPANWRKGSAK